MKARLLFLAIAFCGLSAFAVDPSFTYDSVGFRDIAVTGGGGVISNVAVVVDTSAAVIPWKVEIASAKKTATSTTTEFVPTNYVGVMTSSVTNWYTVADTNKTVVSTNAVTGIVSTNRVTTLSLTNTVSTATVTNRFSSITGLNLSDWAIVSTNGYDKTVSVGTPQNAAGTLTLSDGNGTSWSALTISNGATAESNIFDASKISFGGTLRLTATQAESLRLRIKYVKLKK